MPTDNETGSGAGSLPWLFIFILYFSFYLLVAVEDIFHLGIF